MHRRGRATSSCALGTPSSGSRTTTRSLPARSVGLRRPARHRRPSLATRRDVQRLRAAHGLCRTASRQLGLVYYGSALRHRAADLDAAIGTLSTIIAGIGEPVPDGCVALDVRLFTKGDRAALFDSLPAVDVDERRLTIRHRLVPCWRVIVDPRRFRPPRRQTPRDHRRSSAGPRRSEHRCPASHPVGKGDRRPLGVGMATRPLGDQITKPDDPATAITRRALATSHVTEEVGPPLGDRLDREPLEIRRRAAAPRRSPSAATAAIAAASCST